MRRPDPRVVVDAAQDLTAGGLHCTPRQLYYAVCARMEPAEATPGTGQVAAGVLLIAVAVVGGILVSIYLSLALIPGMVITGMGVQRRRAERSLPTTRPLVIGWDEFCAEWLPQARAEIDGLVEGPPPSSASESALLVVCDRADTAAGIAANAGDDLAVAVEGEVAVAGRRVLAVHDCDREGCALPLRLRDAGADVVDVMLRPAQVRDRRVQVVEGAPAVVPAVLGGLLDADEVIWLAAGRRVEVAVLSPAEVRDAIERAASAGSGEPRAGIHVVATGAAPLAPPAFG